MSSAMELMASNILAVNSSAFAAERNLEIVAWYVENESGAKLARPELFRLLADTHDGDILLIEQVDRLSRLTAADWERLKAELAARRIRVVALDLPASWTVAIKATVELIAGAVGVLFVGTGADDEHVFRE